MPFIPHTKKDVKKMLSVIGIDDVSELFDEIPDELKFELFGVIPKGISEMEISSLMYEKAKQDRYTSCFIGAGAYDHYIPAAVWELSMRGEFYSAYTPYQAEASQGTLQVIYEFQSMMTALTGMDIANASLYDGASSLAEAIFMSIRLNKKSESKSKCILIPRSLHPAYRKTVYTIVNNQGINLIEVPFDLTTGKTDIRALEKYTQSDITALVIPQPNFFGILEDVDMLTHWASERKIITIAVINPIAMAIVTPPGQWGKNGVDICCGEGQPLGIPLSSGGPYFGFMCCRKEYLRQIPGRIVGRTKDIDGKIGYVLTLQAREQHIRRSKATSNICTNQGLMVTAATIYMALLGSDGLTSISETCHTKTVKLLKMLLAIKGIKCRFQSAFFHETVLQFSVPIKDILSSLVKNNVLGGYDLSKDYKELKNCLLICVTEKRSDAELENYSKVINKVIRRQKLLNTDLSTVKDRRT